MGYDGGGGGGGGYSRDGNPAATLFVRNVTSRVSEKHVIKVFSKYGALKRLHIPTFKDGPKEGQPRSFCFIEYETPAIANDAMKALDNRLLAGRRLDIRISEDDKAPVPSLGDLNDEGGAAEDQTKNQLATPMSQQIIAIEAKIRLMDQEPTLSKSDTLAT